MHAVLSESSGQEAHEGVVDVNISPNYLSSDLFTPGQNNRVTFPSIGIQSSKSTHGKTWGKDMWTYGGTGSLPFFGVTRKQDLLVSRSHRHYGSGFTDCYSENQPYQKTSLQLSQCRMNDQILPTSLDSPLHSSPTFFPPSERYWSHVSMFDVFPRNEENLDLRGQEHSVRFPLRARTIEALKTFRRVNYHISRYDFIYHGHSNQFYAVHTRPMVISHPHEPYPMQVDSGIKPPSTQNENQSHVNFQATNDQATQEDDQVETDVESKPQTCLCSECDTLNCSSCCKCLKPDTQEAIAGISPCWPPSRQYVINYGNGAMQIEEGIKCNHIPPIERQCQPKISISIPNTQSSDTFTNHATTNEHKGATARANPHWADVEEWYVKDKPPQKQEAVSRSEILCKDGDNCKKTTLRGPHSRTAHLGVHFKTEARRRYLRRYPESTPDLRDSHITHKKYNFFGYHSSAFRG